MVKRTLERRLLVDSDGETLLEKPIELEYYLVESHMDNFSLHDGNETYGLSISRRISENCFEEEVVENFSSCLNEARDIIEILAGNSVTPGSLMYVLDDILGSL